MKYFSICFLMSLFIFSCSQPKKEKKEEPQIKPSYSMDLNVWHRRDATTSRTWKNIKDSARVHYLKHNLIPMFRMYKVTINPKDTIYDYRLSRMLKSYCGDSLVETNILRDYSREEYIYAGQNGLLPCTDREELYLKVYYREKTDTTSRYQVDSMRYEILLDIEEQVEQL